MKSFLKIVAILSLLVLLLVTLSSVLLHFLLPPDKAAKTLVLKQLTARLGRQVRMQSRCRDFLGLRLSNLEVSEAPDFSKGVFLSSD